jgi:hypothetical protein
MLSRAGQDCSITKKKSALCDKMYTKFNSALLIIVGVNSGVIRIRKGDAPAMTTASKCYIVVLWITIPYQILRNISDEPAAELSFLRTRLPVPPLVVESLSSILWRGAS